MRRIFIAVAVAFMVGAAWVTGPCQVKSRAAVVSKTNRETVLFKLVPKHKQKSWHRRAQQKAPSKPKKLRPVKHVSTVHASRGVTLGEFRITAYTDGQESTGKNPGQAQYGITATGVKATAHHTIASDWSILPPGTVIKIAGLSGRYVVEDRGGGIHGDSLDLYIPDLESAVHWGVQYRQITVMKWGRKE